VSQRGSMTPVLIKVERERERELGRERERVRAENTKRTGNDTVPEKPVLNRASKTTTNKLLFFKTT
jgi:hypothetical protein